MFSTLAFYLTMQYLIIPFLFFLVFVIFVCVNVILSSYFGSTSVVHILVIICKKCWHCKLVLLQL